MRKRVATADKAAGVVSKPWAILEGRFGDLSRYAQAPEFWVAHRHAGQKLIDSLKEAHVRTLAKSAGGREIIALEYGKPEDPQATCDNLHSAIASKLGSTDATDVYPSAFFGKRRRARPVLAIQGALHGGELTGTVAALNLCRVIETGSDLRGKAWPTLERLARDTRILIIPWLNPDGTDRWPVINPSNAPNDLINIATHGLDESGEPMPYPRHKTQTPVNPAKMHFLGTYFNDAGYNLQYDFCMPQRQPETLAWMSYYLDERPDAVLIAHCNAGTLIGPPGYYLPPGYQHTESRIGGAVRARLLREGFNISRLSWAGLPGLGLPVFDQCSAVYHVSGALPIMVEFPIGSAVAPFTCEQMLDIGLITFEEILAFAHTDGLRPYELWSKVKGTLQP